MNFSAGLQISRGLTALIGSGGKTSLLYRLAEELRAEGSVIVCTSTHIRRPPHLPVPDASVPEEVRAALAAQGVVCLGQPAAGGKLSAPALSFTVLTELADFVLVEADGSRQLPMKAHLSHEPVIPPNADQAILVVGACGFDRPIREVCHRPERFAALAQAALSDPVTPERLSRVIRSEALADKVYVNQAETPQALARANALAALLPCPVFAGSLQKGGITCLY